MKKIFMGAKFTGLHRDTTLISLGLVSDDGRTFYAEFNDFDKSQVDEWTQKNVVDILKFKSPNEKEDEHYSAIRDIGNSSGNLYDNYSVELRGDKTRITEELSKWLGQFEEKLNIVGDCLHYDWMLFIDLFGTAFDIPENVYYIPTDICTMLEGIDEWTDLDREDFIKEYNIEGEKHNALHKTRIIKAVYGKIKTCDNLRVKNILGTLDTMVEFHKDLAGKDGATEVDKICYNTMNNLMKMFKEY